MGYTKRAPHRIPSGGAPRGSPMGNPRKNRASPRDSVGDHLGTPRPHPRVSSGGPPRDPLGDFLSPGGSPSGILWAAPLVGSCGVFHFSPQGGRLVFLGFRESLFGYIFDETLSGIPTTIPPHPYQTPNRIHTDARAGAPPTRPTTMPP